MIETKKSLAAALRLIANLITNECGETSMGAYHLRHARAHLLKSRGCGANRTYTRIHKEIVPTCGFTRRGENGKYSFKHVTPVSINYHNRLAIGGYRRTALSSAGCLS